MLDTTTIYIEIDGDDWWIREPDTETVKGAFIARGTFDRDESQTVIEWSNLPDEMTYAFINFALGDY
jgi:hypothetical protein